MILGVAQYARSAALLAVIIGAVGGGVWWHGYNAGVSAERRGRRRPRANSTTDCAAPRKPAAWRPRRSCASGGGCQTWNGMLKMLRAPILTLIASATVLMSCGLSTPSADRIDLRPPDAEVTHPCGRAVQMPEREITQAEAARYHARDRAALAECRGRHGLMVDWIDDVVEAVDAE